MPVRLLISPELLSEPLSLATGDLLSDLWEPPSDSAAGLGDYEFSFSAGDFFPSQPSSSEPDPYFELLGELALDELSADFWPSGEPGGDPAGGDPAVPASFGESATGEAGADLTGDPPDPDPAGDLARGDPDPDFSSPLSTNIQQNQQLYMYTILYAQEF